MYYIIMSTHILLYAGLPHVKGFLMFLGIGPGADSDESHTVRQCSPQELWNPLTCGRPTCNRMCVAMII